LGARLSGGAFEDDGVAEGFELADVLAAKAVGVDAPGVEVRAEVGVAGVGVGEQVPDDDQDGAADGDVGFPGAAAAGDAPVAGAEEAVGLGGGRRPQALLSDGCDERIRDAAAVLSRRLVGLFRMCR